VQIPLADVVARGRRHVDGPVGELDDVVTLVVDGSLPDLRVGPEPLSCRSPLGIPLDGGHPAWPRVASLQVGALAVGVIVDWGGLRFLLSIAGQRQEQQK
jgi:hypothetical protein